MATLVYKHVLIGTSSSRLFRVCSQSSLLYLSTCKISVKNAKRYIYLYQTLPRIHVPVLQQILKSFTTNYANYSQNTGNNEDDSSESIILLGPDDNVLGVKMKSNAKLLANKKDMNLIKVDEETKYKRYPVYQLVRKDQMFKNKSTGNNKKSKNQKRLTISCKISNNDLDLKLKNIEKWLKKENEVFLIIIGEQGREKLMEEIYAKIEKNFKNTAKFAQKVFKNQSTKVLIIPVKESSDPKPQSDENNL